MEVVTRIMKKLTISLILFSLGYTLPAEAQDLKIGFVRSDYILALLPETPAALQDINNYEQELGVKINAMRQGLQVQAAQLQQEAASLSDSARAERERDLQLLQQDINQERQTAQQQLQFKEIQAMSPLRQKVQRAIDSVTLAHSYTHVFADDFEGKPVLLYAQDPEEADLTSLVIDAMGLTVPADTAQ